MGLVTAHLPGVLERFAGELLGLTEGVAQPAAAAGHGDTGCDPGNGPINASSDSFKGVKPRRTTASACSAGAGTAQFQNGRFWRRSQNYSWENQSS